MHKYTYVGGHVLNNVFADGVCGRDAQASQNSSVVTETVCARGCRG